MSKSMGRIAIVVIILVGIITYKALTPKYRIIKNTPTNEQITFHQIVGLYCVYFEIHREYPSSWSDFEEEFGEHVRGDMDAGEESISTVVLLDPVKGVFENWGKSRNPAENQDILLATMFTPLSDKESRGRGEGRWCIWVEPSGRVFSDFITEKDLQSFTAWNQVGEQIERQREL